MLELMRRFASTIVGKIMGGLLLIGLAGFGIQNVLLDLGSDTVVKVGDEEVGSGEFQRSYQAQLNAYTQQTGQQMTPQEALQRGIPGDVLQQLEANATSAQLAKRLGLGVSEAKLRDDVVNDPNFRGILGTFDRQVFDQTLQQNNITEAQFFDLQTKILWREQLGLGLFAGTPSPKASIDLFNAYRTSTRIVEYFTLNQTDVPAIAAPTDADLQAYLTAHQTEYRTKESRSVDLVYLNPDLLSTQYQPTEDEIKAEYDKTKDQLVKVEKRHIVQVPLTTPEAQKSFDDAQTAGTSFADALAASKLTSTDLGTLAKTEVNDTALATAAFGLAKVGDFVVIPGIVGKRVISVTEIQAGSQLGYDDAKADIAKRLAVAKAKAGYADLQDQIESLRAGLKPLSDIATRYKLPIETLAVTADGGALSTVPGLAETDRAKIATAIFAATAGKLAPTINFGASSNAWFNLSKVDAARDQTLTEVRDAITTAWTNAKTDEALQAEVKSIVAELDAGKTFDQVATEKNQFPSVSPPMTRDGDKTNVLTPQVASKIFSGGVDSHGWAVDGDDEYLVYHVKDVTPPTGDPATAITDYVDSSIRGSLSAAVITGLRDDYGVHINQQALSQILNLDQSTQ